MSTRIYKRNAAIEAASLVDTHVGKWTIEAVLAEIESLKEDLIFVERWAVHHAAKPYMTPEQALGCIAHYPTIKAITKSYTDGVLPNSFDPYAEIERKDAALQTALEWFEWFSGNGHTKPTVSSADIYKQIREVL